MHIRTSRVRRNGKVYEYAQLVETYRRESDGMPVHRVLATLTDPIEAQNLREALAAARRGKRVAVARQAPTPSLKPTANLRYLDLAVLLELWRETGLGAVLDELLPAGQASVSPASVVAALTLQRCVDPGSKLSATRWMPRTALPELLGIAPGSFNNTRLHRVLDDLDDATALLMAKLPARYVASDGNFVSLFMDVSDTWFVGEGPSMARRGKTKEGMVQQKIGILLLCNEHGYPVRWEVIEGTQHDSIAMSRMLKSIAGVSWAREAPVVCDRAMGKTAQIREMLGTGLRFLTALTVTEFDSYATSIPHPSLAHFEASDDVKAIAQCIEQAGMRRVRDDLFVLDLGVVVRDDGAPYEPLARGDDDDVAVTAMRSCRQIREAVAQARFASLAAAGRSLGLRKSVTLKYCRLATLSEQQQREVVDGKVRAPLADLLRVAAIKDEAQRDEAFELLTRRPPTQAKAPRKSPPATPAQVSIEPVRVRAVAYFNPERFVHERQAADEKRRAIEAFADDLNARLQAPRSRLTPHALGVLIDRRLRADSLLEAFEVRITKLPASEEVCRVDLVLDAAEWARRRRYDGFTVLVAHPELPQKDEDLCKLYRAKDAVEKDFHVIKSVVEVRPVRHRNDAKVRAHVTLCMLALLLERTLQRRLAKHPDSAETALETLATCHLNLFKAERSAAAYALTHPDPAQRAILRALRMGELADDDCIAQKITPR